MKARHRRMATAVGILILTFGLAATDLLFSSSKNFWAAHALLTNLVSNILFLAIGLTVVEEWIARRDRARLKVVTSAAYSSLSRVPQGQLRMMWFALNGGEFIDDRDFSVSNRETGGIRAVLGELGLTEVTENTVRLQLENIPDSGQRIRMLVYSHDWLVFSYSILRSCLLDFRIVVARWAALLALTDTSSGVCRSFPLRPMTWEG